MSLELRAKELLKVHSPEYVIEKLSQNKSNRKSEVVKAVKLAQSLK